MKKIKMATWLFAVFNFQSVNAEILPWSDLTAPAKMFQAPPFYPEEMLSEFQQEPVYYEENVEFLGSDRLSKTHNLSIPSGACDLNWLSLRACLTQNKQTSVGLERLAAYLKNQNPMLNVGSAWANVLNSDLLKTVEELLYWVNAESNEPVLKNFYLKEIKSDKSNNGAHYTGYFTPLLEVRRIADAEFRFPIYGPPRWGVDHLSRADIDQGALYGQGLEIAWTNDLINLFYAHTQGSALARFADGQELFLDFAGSNNQPYVSIAAYLRNRGYQGSLSNEGIRTWLQQRPWLIAQVLQQNPRYIFFQLSGTEPRTATGTGVIPWHTVAVDDRYIPLGSVLLAEIPRIDAQGRIVGHDWRLLFAQDRGKAIQGPGRLDFYTGTGSRAELATYRLTGARRTYLLLSRNGTKDDRLGRL